MITSKQIANYIEAVLNTISATNDLDIDFNGGVDVVDIDWRRNNFGINTTPFSLATQRFEVDANLGNVDLRYSLYLMPFSDDREKIEYIMEEFYTILRNQFEIDDWQLNFQPINIEYGADFSEGSGLGFQRFEILLTFEGRATNYFTFKDLELTIENVKIPILSFKNDHGKVSYINKTSVVDSNNAHNLNTNMLVIETPLSPENTVGLELLSSRQKVNIDKRIKITLPNGVVIIDDDFEYEGSTFAAGTTTNYLTAFLYFSYAKDKSYISINGQEIPILDYAISSKNSHLEHTNPMSNTVKNLWLARARAYAFNIAEDDEYEVLDALMEDLAGETEQKPVYLVVMNLKGLEITKELVIDDITKESKETSNSIITITFVESGEF